MATIEELLDDFLADQRQRLAPRTYRGYESVVDLLRSCLNGYGHLHLDTADHDRFDQAFASDADAFVHLFGARELVATIPSFLDDFMIRKVMGSEELLRSAGTVTTTLAKWLGDRGELDPADVGTTVERGREAARDLPRVERLANLLCDLAEESDVSTDESVVDDEDYVEDYLRITRVEPTALWFEGDVGPLAVPAEVGAAAQVGWTVNVVLVRSGGRWQLVEVGNVYP